MTALVTGATAGLGAEFARQLAERGQDLVLVARDRERLLAVGHRLTAEFGVTVEVLDADLADRAQLARVEARFDDPESPIEWLVNNAGYGLAKDFEHNSVEQEQTHLDVLVTAPLRLSHAALRSMLPRRRGVIVNVASVAAFTPRGTYGAAKSWVISFSRWANVHYSPSGVTVTAVAPGFVHTEFHDRMNVSKTGIPRVLWLDPRYVVAKTLRAADRRRAVVVPSFRYSLIVALARVLPPRISAAGSLHPN